MSQTRSSGGAQGTDWRLRFEIVLTVSAGLAAAIVAGAMTSSNLDGEGAALAALARASMVAVPIAVGLYAWQSRPADRFGRMLVAAGFAWFLTTFAESSNEVVYSIGRVSGWCVEVGLVWLILAFPSGRLTSRADRQLLGLCAAVVGVFYLPTTFLDAAFPTPSPWTSCISGCPGNAFLLGSEPAWLGDVVVPIREVVTILLFLAVTVRVGQRVSRSTPITRLTLLPVLVVASTRCAIFALAIAVRRVDPASPLADALTWVIALAVPAIALAFLLGLLQRRLYAAGALQQLGAAARGALDRDQLQTILSTAVGDPTLRVVYRTENPPGWLDAEGEPWEAPAPGSGRCLTEIREDGRLVAALVHDEALLDETDFLRAVAAYALTALENRRLAAQVESSLREVRRSRTRIQASGDRERRRIERDLHDGAQQRLVALGIQLELTEDLIREDRERGLERLHELGGEVDRTLEEIQALGRGVYPSLLADRGLAEALSAAAMRLPVDAHVNPDGVGRYPADVENAVYFCCMEAMQNATKHALDAHGITVSLGERDGLVFEVRDDGGGFDHATVSPGVGMTNMHDRLAAVGGTVEVSSSSAGTVVAGRVPAAPAG